MKKQLLLTMTVVLASFTMNAQVTITNDSSNQTLVTTPTGISGFISSSTTATLSQGTTNTGYRTKTVGTSMSCKYEFDVVAASGSVSTNISFDCLTYSGNTAEIKVTVGNETPQTFTKPAGVGIGTYAAVLTNITYAGSVTFTTTPTHVVFEFTDISLGNEAANTFPQGRLYNFKVTGKQTLATNDFKVNSFQVYPNPVNDSFHINTATNQNIESIDFYTVTGQLAKTMKATDNYNVSDLNAGLYLVTIKTDKGSETIKMVKQ